MRRFTFAFTLCLLLATVASAQDHTKVDAMVSRFQRYYNGKQNDSIYNMLSKRIQQLMPLDKVATTMGQLYMQMGELVSYTYFKKEGKVDYYKVVFANVNLQMLASIDSEKKMDVFRFVPDKKEKKYIPEAGASDISVTRDGVVLSGTLTMPVTTAKVPVVLLIAGSGPTDRDGNNSTTLTGNSYRMLADSLRDNGIACVRYDKRGIGESIKGVKSQEEIGFEDYINDAITFIDLLKKDSRFSGVIVAGHSEGSLVGMVAAQKTGIMKYISIAGAGEPIDQIIKWQLSKVSEDMGRRAGIIMDSLKKGYDVQYIDNDLNVYFNSSIQPYLRSWIKFDPAKEIKKLKIPILILQGENDLQVSMVQANLLRQAMPAAKFVTFRDMNHILKDAPYDKEGNRATYTNAELSLTPGFATAVISFIKK